jgi:HSP20 family protein
MAMAIVRWEPGAFSELNRLREEVDRLFTGFTSGTEPLSGRAYPAVNVTEDPDCFLVRAELPGVRPEDLDISVVDGRLLIRGERKVVSEGQGAYYHRREREAGIFRRTIDLPAKVDATRVSAGVKNGVLTVSLPKAEEAKPRRISVTAG